MIEHETLDLAVGSAAPMAANDERPANLDLAAREVVAVVAAGANQPAGRTVDEVLQRPAGAIVEPGRGDAQCERQMPAEGGQ